MGPPWIFAGIIIVAFVGLSVCFIMVMVFRLFRLCFFGLTYCLNKFCCDQDVENITELGFNQGQLSLIESSSPHTFRNQTIEEHSNIPYSAASSPTYQYPTVSSTTLASLNFDEPPPPYPATDYNLHSDAPPPYPGTVYSV